MVRLCPLDSAPTIGLFVVLANLVPVILELGGMLQQRLLRDSVIPKTSIHLHLRIVP